MSDETIGVKCPCCGALLTARMFEDGTIALGHDMPTCADFEAAETGEDALAMIRRARLEAQARFGIGAA